MTLRRAYITHGQVRRTVDVPACDCLEPAGPKGCVCCCGDAIPSRTEWLWLEEMELLEEQLACLQGTGHQRLDAHLTELLSGADASLTRARFLNSDRAWEEAGERFAVVATLTEPPSTLGRLSRRLALRCMVEASQKRRACELFMAYTAELASLPAEGPILRGEWEAILENKLSAPLAATSVVHEQRSNRPHRRRH